MVTSKKKVKTLQVLVTVIIIVLVGYYICSNISDFDILFKTSGKNIAILAFFYVISVYFSAAQNALLMRTLGVPIPVWESFALSNISALVALVVPQGLTITKAVYFKQRYSLPYSKSPVWFLGLLLVFLLIGSLIMGLTNTLAVLQGTYVPGILWIVVFIGMSSSLLFFIDFPNNLFRKLGKLGSFMKSFSDGWKELRMKKLYLLKACLWQMGIFISTGLFVTVAYRSIGINISPMLGMSLSILNFFITLVAVLPGNLGIQEVTYGYFSHLSGLTFVQGVVVSTLMRAVGFVITLVLAPVFWYFLFFRRGIKLR